MLVAPNGSRRTDFLDETGRSFTVPLAEHWDEAQ